jgi:hypothetical protein
MTPASVLISLKESREMLMLKARNINTALLASKDIKLPQQHGMSTWEIDKTL